MIIYTASYSTEEDYQCFMDDGRNYYSSLWDMAEGTNAYAGTDRQRVIDQAKSILVNEMITMESLDADTLSAEEIERKEHLQTQLVFKVDPSNPNYIECWDDPEGLIAGIVIREYEEA